jgi:hypothetical protein
MFGLDTCIFSIVVFVTLCYGIMGSDHVGAKTLSRSRAAVVSTVICLASIVVAVEVHYAVLAAPH